MFFYLERQWFYVEGFFFPCHFWSYSLRQKDAFCPSIKWQMRNIQRKDKKKNKPWNPGPNV